MSDSSHDQFVNTNVNKSAFSNQSATHTISSNQFNRLTKIRNQLLHRILNRLEKKNEIFKLKTGYIAFLKNCITNKKALNLSQIIQRLVFRKNMQNSSDFINRLKKISKFDRA